MEEQTDLYDVVIIGGGPAGLAAGQYAARGQLKTVILDKSAAAGALAYSSRIENYPGRTQPIPGKELLDIMRKQAIDFGADYIETQIIGVNISGEIRRSDYHGQGVQWKDHDYRNRLDGKETRH